MFTHRIFASTIVTLGLSLAVFPSSLSPSEAANGLPSLDAGPVTISISASGDLLAHNTLYTQAKTASGYDFTPMLSPLSGLLTSDIDICHLETPLTTSTPSNYPIFATPHQLAAAIRKAGWEGCSVASNHSLDRGVKGVITTLDQMKAQGLKTAGTRKTEKGSSIAWYAVKGRTVAQLAYTYGFNGLTPPADKPWLVNKINAKSIIAAAKRARGEGADLIVVSLHWGNEYQSNPSSFQTSIARTLTKSPYIDAIIGHHAHVIQKTVRLNGKPVVYGLGNLWSGQGPWADQSRGQHGVIVTLNFAVSEGSSEFSSGSYVPTLVRRGTWVVRDARLVKSADSVLEACRSIKDAAAYLSQVLSGPTTCPKV
ncbi:MAG: hypothetical protein RIS75_165 [Actinomycetota bacterium]